MNTLKILISVVAMILVTAVVVSAAAYPLDDTTGRRQLPYNPVIIYGRVVPLSAGVFKQVQSYASSEITLGTTAPTTEIASTSAADDSGSTGAITVKIFGLNSSFAPISETVTMDGTTVVTCANKYYRVNGMVVQTAGTGGVNAGKITIARDDTWIDGEPQTSANVFCRMEIGECRSASTIKTVAANTYHVVKDIDISGFLTGSSEQINAYLVVKPYGKVATRIFNMSVTDGQRSISDMPVVISPKSDYWVIASSSVTSTTIEVSAFVEEY